jgi:hypothetical protein
LVSTVCPAVLVGNSLYWLLAGNYIGIIEFNLKEQSLAVIQPPVHMLGKSYFLIMRAEDGGLGLLYPTDSSIQLWKRKIDCDGVASWTLGRTIELDKLLSLKPRQVHSVYLLLNSEVHSVSLLLNSDWWWSYVNKPSYVKKFGTHAVPKEKTKEKPNTQDPSSLLTPPRIEVRARPVKKPRKNRTHRTPLRY